MNTQKAAISLLLGAISVAAVRAGLPTPLKGRPLDAEKGIEPPTPPQLPPELHFVAEHPSPLGKRLLPGQYVRDAWIARGNDIVAQIVTYSPSNPEARSFHFAASAAQSVKVIDGGAELEFRVGIISDDPKLTGQLLSWVNGVDLSHIKWTTW